MEKKDKPKPNAVQKTHDQISQLYNSNKTLKQSEVDLNDFSRMINKMYGKYDRSNIGSTKDHIFTIA